MQEYDAAAGRAMFMIRLQVPPLPLLCRSSVTGEEQWCSSHALLSAIAGRLEARGGEWQEGVLTGPHLRDLLESGYDHASLCTYTREVIMRMMSLDAGPEFAAKNSDLRFLHYTGSINWAKHPALCMDAVEYYCMQLALLTDSTSEQVDAVRKSYARDKKPYEDVLQQTVSLLLSRKAHLLPPPPA